MMIRPLERDIMIKELLDIKEIQSVNSSKTPKKELTQNTEPQYATQPKRN